MVVLSPTYSDNQPGVGLRGWAGMHTELAQKIWTFWNPPTSWCSPSRGYFYIDANGILNVFTADKTTGKSSSMTRAAYRMTRMSAWSRRLRSTTVYIVIISCLTPNHCCLAEDEAVTACIASKNGLESYSYNLHNSINNERLADKFNPTDKSSSSLLLTRPSHGLMALKRPRVSIKHISKGVPMLTWVATYAKDIVVTDVMLWMCMFPDLVALGSSSSELGEVKVCLYACENI